MTYFLFKLKVVDKKHDKCRNRHHQMKTIVVTVITVITYHYLCSLLRVFTVLGTIYLPAPVQDYQTFVQRLSNSDKRNGHQNRDWV